VNLPSTAAWAIYHEEQEKEAIPSTEPSQDAFHSFLILSRDDGTMVFTTGEELKEVTDKVDFYVDGPTITVGNLNENKRCVQVYSTGVRLLKGGKYHKNVASKFCSIQFID
jgi:cleavage and polyadenylation specificity factor subunit 1